MQQRRKKYFYEVQPYLPSIGILIPFAFVELAQ